jgi:hypothetical protein
MPLAIASPASWGWITSKRLESGMRNMIGCGARKPGGGTSAKRKIVHLPLSPGAAAGGKKTYTLD